jgi:hypothetical protein
MVSFSIILAKLIGDRKAIFLKEIAYWVRENRKHNRNFYFGIWWTYMSAEGYADKFQCYKVKSIGRWLRELEEDGLIISGSYNRMKADRTKWYTTNPDFVEAIASGEIKKLEELQAWVVNYKKHIQKSQMQRGYDAQKEQSKDHFINPASLKICRALLKMGQAIPPRNPPWDTSRKLIFSLPEQKGSRGLDKQDTQQGTTLQKVAPKSFPKSGAWMQVADDMAVYFKGEGKVEWKRLCAAVQVSPSAVSIDSICSQWAAKHQNAPELIHWKANTGGLIGWIRMAGKAKKRNVRKSNIIGKHSYEQYRN